MNFERSLIKTKFLQALLFAGLLGTVACRMEANRIEQEYPSPGSEYVYGNVDGPPLQAANKYETSQEEVARAAKIREMFFGNLQGTGPSRTAPSSITDPALGEEAERAQTNGATQM